MRSVERRVRGLALLLDRRKHIRVWSDPHAQAWPLLLGIDYNRWLSSEISKVRGEKLYASLFLIPRTTTYIKPNACQALSLRLP